MHIKDSFPELYKIRKPLKLEEAKRRLASARGAEYWRSLEELASSEEFEELLHREFPRHAAEWAEGADRRTFIKLMGASLALAGLSGCSYQPPESIVPYVRQPEEFVPGRPLFFATAMPMLGVAAPLIVRSNMGRPTKIEGNDLHPASAGAADLFSQASILTLYDPDRSQVVINRGSVRSYTAFLAEMSTALEGQRAKGGAGLRFLTETITSPTAAAQMREISSRLPNARWHAYEPAAGGASVGAQAAFGDFANTIYDFTKAARVLSLDSDFLSCGPASLRYARDFASARRVTDGQTEAINRLYVLEATPTNTGLCADHRLAIRPSEMESFARSIAAGLGVAGAGVGVGAGLTSEQAAWVSAVIADLNEHRGRSVVIVGDEQPPLMHALGHAMNAALGNTGQTVRYTDPIEVNPVDHLASLRTLISDIDAGAVELLVIVGGNPVYTTPADLKLDEKRMKKIPKCVHLSLYDDETSELCHWHIPETHYLEAWGDARSYDGTVSIIQPLIAPLYNGKSLHEFLAAFSERPERTSYQIVREFWMTQMGGGGLQLTATAPLPGLVGGAATAEQPAQPQPGAAAEQQPAPRQGAATGGATSPAAAAPAATAPALTGAASEAFEAAWRRAVHDGFIPGTAARDKSVSVRPDLSTAQGAATQPAAAADPRSFEVVFRADPSVFDGRFANNGWLQELPKPLTKLTWDNAALISPATAERLGLGTTPDGAAYREGAPRRTNRITGKGGEIMADVVRLRFKGGEVSAPVWITPGQPDNVVTLHLGYGRERSGHVGGDRERTVGFNAYRLRTSDAMWAGAGLEVQPSGESFPLASTQIHFSMEGRDIVRSGTFDDYRKQPQVARAGEHSDRPAAEEGMKGTGGESHGEASASAQSKPGHESESGRHTESLYPGSEHPYVQDDARGERGYKWGMAIDLSTCVGCNACIVACQSENNIPIVGKEQVARSREMHWLRVDAYFRGAVENPSGVYFMPVPCMHCEQAPCEPVCPVHATVHSSEGLNDMVYNRCVGTRYCSNNCPYKVRRFNFLLYQDWTTPSLKMLRNPEVTVRSRGVMEKCTYCVQRIEYAKIEAEKEGRRVRDGDIVTACQATCPTESIIFGDLNDPGSKVARLQSQRRNYGLLDDLNTRPRTTYLASVRNPNPTLERKA
jgi:molybdopterin-containing oxidoreductase family iron-sulfur binding subunit